MKLKETFQNLIIDNTQGFFCDPIKGAYNVYSCRKFFGVSDGAYLIKDGIGNYSFKRDKSSYRASFLLTAIETGSNISYKSFISSEEELSSSEILEMSSLTRSILGSIDYQTIKDRRVKNFKYLSNKLDKYNDIKPTLKDDTVPMVYPFVYKDGKLRQYLLNNKIYISQWWKYCINNKYSTEVEKIFSKFLLPLPIDQRYDTNVMDIVAALIDNYISDNQTFFI